MLPWTQISMDTLQNLVEILPIGVEAVKTSKRRGGEVQFHINAHGFGIGWPTRSCRCDGPQTLAKIVYIPIKTQINKYFLKAQF